MRARILPIANTLTPLQSLIARRWRPQWICHECKHRQLQRRTLSTTTTTQDETTKPYYATTPIFYVNAAPHVGHMYTMILTDVLTRWQRLKKPNAILCTGTDEHGLKIQQAAFKAKTPPKEFCDKGADVFRDLASRIDISNDIFIRTTDKRHVEGVQYAWQMLERGRWIYESKHEGWYSISDETFYPEGQVQLIVEPATGRKIMVSVETGKEVEWTSERNYHFRLSAFRERLLEFYEKNPSFIVPKSRMDDVVREVSQGLNDLSISRPVERLQWGIPVPTDPSQTIYVWLDALLNYATAAGYPFSPSGPQSQTPSGWPPDLHVIGKDIIRFHTIYWPAFLMALDLPLPKQVLTHAHWTLGRQKMAKSTGNVVNPFWALERFGVDTMRWFLIHDGGISDDADYDNSFIIEKYKKGLQGGLGNLTSRIMRFRGWSVPRAVEKYAGNGNFTPANDQEKSIYENLITLPTKVNTHMLDLQPNRALQTIMRAIYDANAYIQQSSPWDLAKNLPTWQSTATFTDNDLSPKEIGIMDQMDRIVYLNAETLRLVGIMLQAFMPGAGGRLLDMIGVDPGRRGWEWCEVGKDGPSGGVPGGGFGVPMVDLEVGKKRGLSATAALFPALTSDF